MTLKEKLLKRLPKEYHDRVIKIEEEPELSDDCKYVVYIDESYELYGDAGCFPARNIAEAARLVKDTNKIGE